MKLTNFPVSSLAVTLKGFRSLLLFIFIISLITLSGIDLASAKADKSDVMKKVSGLQIPFIENKGQIRDRSARFYANTFAGTVYVTEKGELIYTLPKQPSNDKLRVTSDEQRMTNDEKSGVALKETFKGQKISKVRGMNKAATKVNYFKGNKENWNNNIQTWLDISFGEVYENIDLSLRAYGNNVEKLFTVHSEGSVEDIRIEMEGAEGLRVNREGELEVITELGTVTMTKPVAYQEIDGKRIDVPVNYIIAPHGKKSQNSEFLTPNSTSYGFYVGKYDRSRDLVIDPLLASTFIGGTNNEFYGKVAVDPSGNIFVASDSLSSDYPVTPGAYDETRNSATAFDNDIVISKLDSDLTTLLASTYIGGSYDDTPGFITIDSAGDVYITGLAGSADYPTTAGAFDESYNGDTDDGFISKLDNDLGTLLASTFIGGSNKDSAASLVLDSTGNVLMVGSTGSSDYPTTAGAYDEVCNGMYSDVVISKLDSDLSTLIASTCIGGNYNDYGNAIALDSAGNVFITGSNNVDGNYPTTPGAYDRSHNGWNEIIISKLDSDLGTLIASTYLGGRDSEGGSSIALDSSDNVFVSGTTSSSDYPTTAGAFDESPNYRDDVFISKLNNDLSTLLASTVIGGDDYDQQGGMVLNSRGNVIITGSTGSSDFPTTPGAYDETGQTDGMFSKDVFISRFNNDLNILLDSTYIGGSGSDWGRSITLDSSGNILIGGSIGNDDYPTTPGAYSRTKAGFRDLFITKFFFAMADTDSVRVEPSVVPNVTVEQDGATATEVITVYNDGTTELTFSILDLESWLSADITRATVPAGGFQNVVLTYSPLGLGAADYATSIFVISNDPENEKIELPASMTVTTDVTPPADIDDLAVSDVTFGTALLNWTAVADSGSSGKAAVSYDLRYSTSLMTVANWDSADRAAGEPSPGLPGTAESFEVKGLQRETTYYFGIKVIEDNGLISGLSNVVSVTTLAGPEIRIEPLIMPAVTLEQDRQATEIMTIYNEGTEDLVYSLWVQTAEQCGTAAQSSTSLQISVPNDNMPLLTESEEAAAGPVMSHISLLASGISLQGIEIGYDATRAWPYILYIEGLFLDLEARGANITEITTGPITAQILRNYDIFWIQEGSGSWTGAEISAVLDWVNAGGSLMVHGGYHEDSLDLLGAFGYTVAQYGAVWGITTNIEPHFTTEGVSDIYIDWPVAHIESGPGQIIVRDPAGSDAVSVYECGAGRMSLVAMEPIFNDRFYYYNDNRKLANNIIDWFALDRWATPDRRSGTIPPGGSEQVVITYNADYLETGEYLGEIILSSDSPEDIEITVPASMIVTPDITPPGDVNDLAVAGTTFNTVLLNWTASADNGSTGKPAEMYDVRYSTTAITAANWNTADQAAGEPVPEIPGTAESFVVEGLLPETTYYFAVKVIDDAGISSGLSNTVSSTTPGEPVLEVNPLSVTETLMVGETSSRTITLSNTGDDILEYSVAVRNVLSQKAASSYRSQKLEPIKKIPKEAEYAPGEIIVKRVPGLAVASAASMNSVKQAIGAKVKRKIPRLNLEIWELPEAASASAISSKADKTANRRNADKKLLESIAAISADPNVLYAEPNYIYRAIDFPDDPRFDELWGMHNTGQTGGTADADIDAPEAWDIYKGDSRVVVAVIDTGVNYTHEDLADNMWVNTGEIAGNGVDDDGNGYIDDIYGYDFYSKDSDPDDGHNHGTHCAGTIGGVGDNAIGVAGVNHNVKIMAVKFLSDSGSGYLSDAIPAIIYAVDNGAKILSNSWGGGGYSQALEDAILYANDNDVLFVAAAGNSSADSDMVSYYPQGYDLPNVMSIAATDHNDQLASFSNWGLTTVDLGAPGVDILSTIQNNAYNFFSGTSMATPHVSGAAALLKGYNQLISAQDIKSILMESADPVASLAGRTVSGGRLNIANALVIAPASWLLVNGDMTGTIISGASVDITLDLLAEDVPAGEYAAEIRIDSNDPDNPREIVPVTLTVISPLDTDNDGDGYTENQGDCDDTDEFIYPGASETWYDGTDQDCDGWNDYDSDMDTYVDSAWNAEAGGTSPGTDDCDDNNSVLHPYTYWYPDSDGDSYGNPTVSLQQCTQPADYVLDNTDCDDNDQYIYPGGPPVRIDRPTPEYYSTLIDAYNNAAAEDILQCQETVFAGDMDFDKSVTIEGGYNCEYSAVTGKTTINGDVTISNGTVVMENIIVK